jgi:2-oxoglutarate decarboxylase
VAQLPAQSDPTSFGPNQWLVDELYEQYLEDKNAVDEAWWPFFDGYMARGKQGGNGSAPSSRTSSAAAPPAPQQGSPAAGQQPGPRRAPAPAPAPAAAASTGSAPTPQPAAPNPPAQHAAQKQADAAAAPQAGEGDQAATKPAPDRAAAATTGAESKAASAGGDETSPAAPAPGAKAAPTPRDTPQVKNPKADDQDVVKAIKGPAARIVTNMDASLAVPTATSVRAVPAKAMIDNRAAINQHLRRTRGGKISFTHLIGYAIVQALKVLPDMNANFKLDDAGKPVLIQPAHINFGLAIDLPKPDGTRSLVVPSVKAAEKMDFFHFWNGYEELMRKARTNKLTVDDFAGHHHHADQPRHDRHRAVRAAPHARARARSSASGALDYPAEFAGQLDPQTIAEHGISKVITITVTYDHRIIQGAESALPQDRARAAARRRRLLRRHLPSSACPTRPCAGARDDNPGRQGQGRPREADARADADQHAPRARATSSRTSTRWRGRSRRCTRARPRHLRPHHLGPRPRVPHRRRRRRQGGNRMKLGDLLHVLRDAYCRTIGIEYMHISEPEQKQWIQEQVEGVSDRIDADEQRHILGGSTPPRRSRSSSPPSTSARSASASRAPSRPSRCSTPCSMRRPTASTAPCMGMAHRGRLNVLAPTSSARATRSSSASSRATSTPTPPRARAT